MHNLIFINGMQVLRERKCGYGILVSSVRKDTDAFYSLRDPSEVIAILRKNYCYEFIVSPPFGRITDFN